MEAQVVTTLLLHAPGMLTVPELLRLQQFCKQWHSVVQDELAAYTQAVLPMYRFLVAWPSAPHIRTPDGLSMTSQCTFTEADWQPFLAVLGTSTLTPRQWALYYTFCFWMCDQLRPSYRAGVTKHVTMCLFPSGLVAHLSTQYTQNPPAPFIQYDQKGSFSHDITLSLAACNNDFDVDVWALGGAMYLYQAFHFEFVVENTATPAKFTLFELTDDMKTFAAYRLAHWCVRKTVKLSQLEAC